MMTPGAPVRHLYWLFTAALAAMLAMGSASAYNPNNRTLLPNQTPHELKDIGITEQPGRMIDLGLRFTDENGRSVQLRDFYHKGRPVIVSLVYYACPHLCNFHLNGLTDTFKEMNWTLGDQFEAVAVSIDPKEDAKLAQAKKEAHMKVYGRPEGAKGWHFLTGSDDQIKQLAEQVGFKYRWDEAGQQWAHASAAVVTTPNGKISRYFPGIAFDPKSFKLALIEASEGKVGGVIESLIMYCFQFDPAQHKYVFYAWSLMQLGASLTILVLGVWLAIFWSRHRKQLKGVPS